MPTRCLITGCDLVIPSEGKWLHGDLHDLDYQGYIFNGVVWNGETQWQHSTPPTEGRIITLSGSYFERRGVVVFYCTESNFNEATSLYIRGTPK